MKAAMDCFEVGISAMAMAVYLLVGMLFERKDNDDV